MNLALEVGFWVMALIVFAALPNLALSAQQFSEKMGVSYISEKNLREGLRSYWWFMLGIAVIVLAEGLLHERAFEGLLTALWFVVLGFRLRQVKLIHSREPTDTSSHSSK